MEHLKEHHVNMMQYSVKPHENGDAISPTQSCILSLSDSFVSQCDQPAGLTERSATVDSFWSGSSLECDSSGSSTPTLTGTIRHRPKRKRDRPLSETHENTVMGNRSDCSLPSRVSSPNLASVADSRAVVKASIFPTRRCPKHELIRQPSYQGNDEKQRLLSSPKHSNTYPHLKKLSVTAGCYKHEDKADRDDSLKRSRHRNSDSILVRTQKMASKRMGASSSFLRQLGDKIRGPIRKSADPSQAWRRPTEHGDKTVALPPTAPSATKFEVHRQDTARAVNTDFLDSRPWVGKTGTKAFLLQKVSCCREMWA